MCLTELSFSAPLGFNVQHFQWLYELYWFRGRHGAGKRNYVEI